MPADHLVIKGARASAERKLAQLFQNISVSSPKELSFLRSNPNYWSKFSVILLQVVSNLSHFPHAAIESIQIAMEVSVQQDLLVKA